MNAIPYHLLALAVAVCWGLSVNSTKVLIDAGFGPWAVLALRTVLAYGLLIFLSPKIFYTNLRTEVKTALLGIALVPLAHGLQNLALASGQSSTTAVLTATAPIFTGLLAVAFFREFRFHWMSLAGTLAAIVGAACLAVDAAWIAHLPEIGLWLALASAFGWAVYAMVLRTLGSLSPLLALRKCTGYGLLAMLPFYYAEPTTKGELLMNAWNLGNVLFLAFVSLGLAHAAWHAAVRRIGEEAASFYTYAAPLAALGVGVGLMGETMSWLGILGTVLVMAGVVVAHAGLVRVALAMTKHG